jgi:hypothetical protein
VTALILFDVRVDPVSPVPWGGLLVLLLIVFVLAVSLIVGLVFFLLWWQGKKIRDQQTQVETQAS